jgi:hypothetical protein
MAHLKSRMNCPPNGFQYRQPETGWHTQAWDFNSVVAAVVNHRRANSRFSLNSNPAQVAEDVDVQNAARCLAMTGADGFVAMAPVGGDDSPKFLPLRKLAGAAAGFVAGVKQMHAGVQVLVDWLGDGAETVPAALAAERAKVCSLCSLNQGGDWSAHFTGPISERIRTTLEMRKEMKIETSFDDALGVCAACACPLKLKIHVPMNFISAHAIPKMRSDLDPGCWMIAEGL